jgi:hypothetical protein
VLSKPSLTESLCATDFDWNNKQAATINPARIKVLLTIILQLILGLLAKDIQLNFALNPLAYKCD